MSDAGDDVQTDGAVQQEVVAEPPKGKMSVEDALQVRSERVDRVWLTTYSFYSYSYSK